jgi:SRSO17 transposase
MSHSIVTYLVLVVVVALVIFCACRVTANAFIDRALYLPKGWTDDPARLKATYVPGDIGFSTKPQLAAEMIERALAAA